MKTILVLLLILLLASPAIINRTKAISDVPQPIAINRPVQTGTMCKDVSGLDQYDSLINASVARYGFPDPNMIKSVMKVESGGDPGAHSNVGKRDYEFQAMGLMQIIPANQRNCGMTNPYDPEQSIDCGVKMLSEYWIEYSSVSSMLIAYHGGEGRVSNPREIDNHYVNLVLGVCK